jgi:hypothetical protein
MKTKKRFFMSIRSGAITGAIVGAAVAAVLLSLHQARLFSPNANSMIELLTFRLCPLYILVFANGMGSMTVLVIVTILGNAILYGGALGIVAALGTLFQRSRT